MNDSLKLVYSPVEIQRIVSGIAADIRKDFPAGPPLLIGVLKGAFVFMADLVRAMQTDVDVDFLQTASYGRRDLPTTEVLITRDITSEIEGRHVIIVEGIVDRGHTARAIVDYLTSKEPASVRLCSLLVRGGIERGIRVDYPGAQIGQGFVVGYGMDYRERYRELAGIHLLDEGRM